jgi:hypothetical protein
VGEVSDIALKFEAVKIAWRQNTSGYVMSLAIHPNDTPNDLALASLGTRYMVVMVALSDQDEPVPGPETRQLNIDIKSAGMLCRNPRFWQWIYDRYRDQVGNEEEAADWLRAELGVKSRSDIKTDDVAREKYLAVKRAFSSEVMRN